MPSSSYILPSAYLKFKACAAVSLSLDLCRYDSFLGLSFIAFERENACTSADADSWVVEGRANRCTVDIGMSVSRAISPVVPLVMESILVAMGRIRGDVVAMRRSVDRGLAG